MADLSGMFDPMARAAAPGSTPPPGSLDAMLAGPAPAPAPAPGGPQRYQRTTVAKGAGSSAFQSTIAGAAPPLPAGSAPAPAPIAARPRVISYEEATGAAPPSGAQPGPLFSDADLGLSYPAPSRVISYEEATGQAPTPSGLLSDADLGLAPASAGARPLTIRAGRSSNAPTSPGVLSNSADDGPCSFP